jgi:hypothetical protein
VGNLEWRENWEVRRVNSTDGALLGALVGAGVALAGSVLTSVVLWRIEHARQEAAKIAAAKAQQAAKTAADVETLRRHTADVFSELFALNHAISWITWFAEHAPHAVDQQMRESFDAETHGTFPKVLAAMAMVASVNLDFYSRLRPLQQGVFALWERVARALHQEPGPNELGPNSAMLELAACWPRAEELDNDLPASLQQMMEMANKRRSLLQMLTRLPRTIGLPGFRAQKVDRREFGGSPPPSAPVYSGEFTRVRACYLTRIGHPNRRPVARRSARSVRGRTKEI